MNRAIRIGGWSLVTAALGFVAVFSYLAARFNYPDVLDGSAAVVLPRLLELGSFGRAVWAVYAGLPFLLIPAGIGACAAMKHFAPNMMRTALILAVVSAFTMFLGLARWPTIHWALAQAYSTAPAETQSALAAVFAGLNTYLGNYIGEFVGEVALNGFFVLSGAALLRAGRKQRGFGLSGIVVGVAGWFGAFRNVTGWVQPIAELNNYLLPLWLIVLGVLLILWPVAEHGQPVYTKTTARPFNAIAASE